MTKSWVVVNLGKWKQQKKKSKKKIGQIKIKGKETTVLRLQV